MHPFADFRELNSEIDWPLFDANISHSSEARAATRALSAGAAAMFWQEQFSRADIERHPRLLPSTHWLRATVAGPNWIAEFNGSGRDEQARTSEVSSYMRASFGIAEAEPIYFVAMREQSYLMPSYIAWKAWPCFLAIEDEGSLFYHPPSGRFAQFAPNGFMGLGRKAQTPPSAA